MQPTKSYGRITVGMDLFPGDGPGKCAQQTIEFDQHMNREGELAALEALAREILDSFYRYYEVEREEEPSE